MNDIYILRITQKEHLDMALRHEDLYKDMYLNESRLQNVTDSNLKDWVILIPMKAKIPLGVISFMSFQPHGFMGHWGFYKHARGVDSIEASEKALEYMQQHFPKSTIVGITPESNRSVGLAQKLGFRVVGFLENSTDVNGFIENQIIVQKNLG